MLWQLLLVCIQSFSVQAAVQTIEYDFIGFVPVKKDLSLYVEYKKAQNNAPTVVLLNGLTYSTKEWNLFTQQLLKLEPKLGILRFDMNGMGQTLASVSINFSNNPFYDQYALPYQQQVKDVNTLINYFVLPKERTYLVGLSYGGAIAMNYIATYPGRVQSAVLMAPFVSAIKDVDEWVKKQIELTKLNPFNPLNNFSEDTLYDYYLKVVVYQTFPSLEPVVLETPYKLEAAYRLTQGIRKFKALNITNKFPKNSVHLVVGHDDEYIKQEEFLGLWSRIPQSAKMSFLTLENSKHKLPEERPAVVAKWVKRILDKDPELTEGKEFIMEPK